MKIFNELWLGKTSYCSRPLLQQGKTPKGHLPTAQVATCYAFGADNVNLHCGPIIWQSTLLGWNCLHPPHESTGDILLVILIRNTRNTNIPADWRVLLVSYCKLISIYKCINNSMKRLISIHSLKAISNSLKDFISRLLYKPEKAL